MKAIKLERGLKIPVDYQLYGNVNSIDALAGQLISINKFQQNVNKSVVNQMKEKMDQYRKKCGQLFQQQQTQKAELDAVKSEAAAWQKDKRNLVEENKQLRQQNSELVKHVSLLKHKLTDERHASGGLVRRRAPEQRTQPQRSGPCGSDVLAAGQRLTVAALDDKPTPQTYRSTAQYVPAFPLKKTPTPTTLTLNTMRNSAGHSRMSVDYSHNTAGSSFHFK